MNSSNKVLRIFCAGMVFAMCSLAAYADSSHDPRVIIKGATGPNPHEITGEGVNFQFSLPTNHGQYFTGDLTFSNATSKTWTTLALFESSVAATNVTCGQSSFFNHCQVFIDPTTNKVEILFSNTVGYGKLGTGILPGENFTLGFSKGKGPHSWPSGTTFDAVATTAVPEPSTLAFLFTGIGAIVSRRKLWKRAS
jgi:hypothetical protein